MKIQMDTYFNRYYKFTEKYIIAGLSVKVFMHEESLYKAINGMCLVNDVEKTSRSDIFIVLTLVPNLSQIPIHMPKDSNWTSSVVSNDIESFQCSKDGQDINYIRHLGRNTEISPFIAMGHRKRILLFITDSHSKMFRNSLRTVLHYFLRMRSLFALHAAYLTKDDANILFPGNSGCGKTTIAMNLVRKSFICRGDDISFLLSLNSHVEIIPFSTGVLIIDYKAKMPMDIKHNYPYYKTASIPNFIVFPSICKIKKSRIMSLAINEAMMKITGNFVFSCTPDKESYIKDIELLRNLIRQCRSYSLLAGTDIIDSPSRLTSLLREAIGAGI